MASHLDRHANNNKHCLGSQRGQTVLRASCSARFKVLLLQCLVVFKMRTTLCSDPYPSPNHFVRPNHFVSPISKLALTISSDHALTMGIHFATPPSLPLHHSCTDVLSCCVCYCVHISLHRKRAISSNTATFSGSGHTDTSS